MKQHFNLNVIRIYFNRYAHLFGLHFCICNKLVLVEECFGVIDNDCLICSGCWFKAQYNNGESIKCLELKKK